MNVSSARQRNAVSEGAALGIVLCGFNTLPNDESAIDSASTMASRSWQHARSFPQVAADIRNGKNGYLVLTRADFGKQTFDFYWDADSDELRIRPRPQWRHNQLDEAIIADGIDGNVPVSGWHDLGRGVVERLGLAVATG